MTMLIPVPDLLRSSYDEKGRTMWPNGQRVPFDRLQALSARDTGRATPGTIRALVAVDAELRSLTGEGNRHTEAYRPWSFQERQRVALDAWIQAGRPAKGDAAWRTGMRSAYVASPGQSGHGWGGSTDLHVYVLAFPGIRPGTDAALSALWDVMEPHGFRPIIADPKINASEAWHFDHFGPLDVVRRMFYEHRRDGAQYRNPYGLTMQAGHALVGTWQGGQTQERYLQACILLGGEWCGLVDGRPGKLTREAFVRLTGSPWPDGGVVEAINIVRAVEPVQFALAEL